MNSRDDRATLFIDTESFVKEDRSYSYGWLNNQTLVSELSPFDEMPAYPAWVKTNLRRKPMLCGSKIFPINQEESECARQFMKHPYLLRRAVWADHLNTEWANWAKPSLCQNDAKEADISPDN